MLKNILLFSCIALSLISLAGCGNGLASLEGDITLDGKAVPEGIVLEFVPLDTDVNVPSYATTDDSGHYVAAFSFSEKGIQPGKYTVRLDPTAKGDGSGVRLDENDNPIEVPVFPQEYYQSIQEIEVTKGSNVVDLTLTSDEG